MSSRERKKVNDNAGKIHETSTRVNTDFEIIKICSRKKKLFI